MSPDIGEEPGSVDALWAFADEHSPDVCLIIDSTATIVYVSRSAERVAGWRRDDLIGRSGFDLLHPDDLDYALGSLFEANDNPGEHNEIELRVLRKDGTWMMAEMRSHNPPDDPGGRCIISITDITGGLDLPERRRRFEKLVLEIGARCAGASVDGLDDVIAGVADKLGTLLEADEVVLASIAPDRADLALWGWSRTGAEAVPGFDPTVPGLDRSARAVTGARIRVELAPSIRTVVDQPVFEGTGTATERVTGMLSVFWHGVDARRYWDEGNASLLQAAGEIMVMTAQRVQRERTLAYQALHDGLTGLANRTRLLAALDHELNRVSGRSVTGLALAFCDLDRFKAVNDTWGHQAGDELLKAVGARVVDSVRGGDLVCRVGGDEFVVLCPELDHRDTAWELARRVADHVAAPLRLSGGATISVSASIGVVMVRSDARGLPGAEEVLRIADQAMYEAKAQPGRGIRLVELDVTDQLSNVR